MLRHSQFVCAAALVALCAIPAIAQNTPVVFVHGLGSDGGTWAAAAGSLQEQLQLEAYRPTQSWQEQFPDQASQLHGAVGTLAGSTVAVGHSNGGIVAREWSRLRPLAGVVTLGTPHGGAPLAHNLLRWSQFNFELYNRIDSLFSNFGQCIAYACGWQQVIFNGGLSELLSEVNQSLHDSLTGLVVTAGFQIGAPVMPQMSPQSNFIAGLNSSGNLNREAGAIGSRVGIVSVAHNFFDAGWWRVRFPESADTVDNWVDAAAILLDYGAEFLWSYGNSNSDTWATDVAAIMSSAAGRLYLIDRMWCQTVSSTVPFDPKGQAICSPNDTIVPDWSQVYPNAARIDTGNEGPVHIKETTQSNTWLYQALTNYMNIAPRSGSGGGVWYENHAIRGCSNWTWLDPVYTSSPEACAVHCANNSADACEWRETSGECYAEFGSGCQVEPGWGEWYAMVLNGAPPPPPPPGGGTWYADHAIRGCSDWTWQDAHYTSSPEACASHCASQGADACEWYEPSGECYAEFSSGGCHVEAGYSGWYAVVM